MFVLINLEQLSVCAKHESFNVLCTLAEIECAVEASYVFALDDMKPLDQLTTHDLISLYRNMTGHSFVETDGRDVIKNNVFQALHNIDQSLLNLAELKKQADKVPSDTDINFIYVQGSSTPQPAINGDGLLFITTQHTIGLTKHTVTPVQRKAAPQDKAMREKVTGPAPALTAGVKRGEGSAPRQGGACAAVWAMCDELLASFGRMPTGPEVKNEGLARGLNPSTCSVQFNKWKKAKNV